MTTYLAIFVGGGMGSLCRYSIARMLDSFELTFPFATLLANIFSCFILGILAGLSLKGNITPMFRLMLVTGFCGGFSTFSTFTAETFQLFEAGYFLATFANILLSLIICLAALFIGIKVISE